MHALGCGEIHSTSTSMELDTGVASGTSASSRGMDRGSKHSAKGQEMLDSIATLKESINRLQQQQAATTGDDDQIRKEIQLQRMTLLKLKKLNRLIFSQVKDCTDEATKAKEHTESKYRRLQLLEYRRANLQRDVRLSAMFPTEQVSKIELVGEEVFRSTAPMELVQVGNASDGEASSAAKDPAHQLFLNRLQHELELRKALQQEVNALKQDTSKVNESIASKRQEVDSLKGSFVTLKDATKAFKKADKTDADADMEGEAEANAENDGEGGEMAGGDEDAEEEN